MFGFTPFGDAAFGQVPEETTTPPPPPPPVNTFVPWIYGIIIALRDEEHRKKLKKESDELAEALRIERELEEMPEPIFSRCESFGEAQECDLRSGQASFSEGECRSTIGRTEFNVGVIRPVRSRSYSRSPVQSSEAFAYQDFSQSELIERELEEIALLCAQSKPDEFESLELIDTL